MTEAEWRSCIDPESMILALKVERHQRELRLFATACVRRVWAILPPGCRAALELSERYADGRVTEGELAEAGRAAEQEANAVIHPVGGPVPPDAEGFATRAAVHALSVRPLLAEPLAFVINFTSAAAAFLRAEGEEEEYDESWQSIFRSEHVIQAGMLRDLLPSPRARSGP